MPWYVRACLEDMTLVHLSTLLSPEFSVLGFVISALTPFPGSQLIWGFYVLSLVLGPRFSLCFPVFSSPLELLVLPKVGSSCSTAEDPLNFPFASKTRATLVFHEGGSHTYSSSQHRVAPTSSWIPTMRIRISSLFQYASLRACYRSLPLPIVSVFWDFSYPQSTLFWKYYMENSRSKLSISFKWRDEISGHPQPSTWSAPDIQPSTSPRLHDPRSPSRCSVSWCIQEVSSGPMLHHRACVIHVPLPRHADLSSRPIIIIRASAAASGISRERRTNLSHTAFITAYCYSCLISLLVVATTLSLCLIHKLNFITGTYVRVGKYTVYTGFSTICGFWHPLGVLDRDGD